MTEQEAAEWQERLAAMVAKNTQQRTTRKAERADMNRRRAHAKAKLHAAKLAKNRQDKQP